MKTVISEKMLKQIIKEELEAMSEEDAFSGKRTIGGKPASDPFSGKKTAAAPAKGGSDPNDLNSIENKLIYVHQNAQNQIKKLAAEIKKLEDFVMDSIANLGGAMQRGVRESKKAKKK